VWREWQQAVVAANLLEQQWQAKMRCANGCAVPTSERTAP
jgi:hypothetical protein